MEDLFIDLIFFFPETLFLFSEMVNVIKRSSTWGQRLKEQGVRRCRRRNRWFLMRIQIWSTYRLASAERLLSLLFSSGRLFIHDVLHFSTLVHKM